MKFSVQLLALLLFGFLLVSCDSSGGNDDGLPVEGTWERVAEEISLYLEITSESVTQYVKTAPGDCYDVFNREIVERDGNSYTLRYEDGDTTTVMMTVDGNELTVQYPKSEERVYEETNVDPSEFERCN